VKLGRTKIRFGSISIFLLSAAAACASTIVFEGAPTGVNDGSWYVLPYEITIDGSSQLVACYDTFDDVNSGDTWNASLLTLDQAANSGYFTAGNALANYERIAWLYAQPYSDTDQQIGLQYAIWNVFGSAPNTADSIAFENAATQAAANGYQGFDFSGFRFIQQPGITAGSPGAEQAFVYQVSVSGRGNPVAPEPSTLWSLAGGLFFLSLFAIGKRFRPVPQPKPAEVRVSGPGE
jgi:hypothetical protein